MATRNPARKPVEVKVVFYHNLQGFSTIQPRVNHQQYFSKRHLNYKMDPGSSYELNGFFSSPRVLGTPTKAINSIWGLPKMVPNNHGVFPTKNDHDLGCDMGGNPPFKETPTSQTSKYFGKPKRIG